MRRICYVSGSRADFGLIERALKLAIDEKRLEISICVTGQHLSPLFGETVRDIEASGLRICGKVPVDLDQSSGEAMAKAIGHEIIGITAILSKERPDAVIVLGDRGEMLAGAISAIHLNIPVIHLHGGERSGTVDEPVRHAVSKLAHYHFVVTEGARDRLIKMGEEPDRIFVTGAPGLDGMKEQVERSRKELCDSIGFDSHRDIALVLFHPVLQQADLAARQIKEIMHALDRIGLQSVCFMPNSDAGGLSIRNVLDAYRNKSDFKVVTHLQRREFVSWMAAADLMVGNSSSGIIEAASFNLPVVNVGDRQHGRERSANTVDVPADAEHIEAAIRVALRGKGGPWSNVYGDGRAGSRIVDLLVSLPLSPSLMMKSNAY